MPSNMSLGCCEAFVIMCMIKWKPILHHAVQSLYVHVCVSLTSRMRE